MRFYGEEMPIILRSSGFKGIFLNTASRNKILNGFFCSFDQTVVMFQSLRLCIYIKEQMLDILYVHKLTEVYIEEKHICGIEHENTSDVEQMPLLLVFRTVGLEMYLIFLLQASVYTSKFLH